MKSTKYIVVVLILFILLFSINLQTTNESRFLFDSSKWVMYCAERDPNPDRDGCRAMQTSRELVMKHGGKVELFIKDPIGDHGGFHRNPSNVNRALDVFEQLIR